MKASDIANARRDFAKILGPDAAYLKIKPNTKQPVGSFLEGRRNRYKRPPKAGSYGVIPQGRLFILDIDVNKGGVLKEQIELFSELLKIDLTTTLTVISPSGGQHFYLRLPENSEAKNFPKANLRKYAKEILAITGIPSIVDADIRSGAAAAYVLGPTSSINNRRYMIAGNKEIQTIGDEGLKHLLSLEKKREKARKKHKLPEVESTANLFLDPDRELIHDLPAQSVITAIYKGVGRKKLSTFHQKRAFVKSALQCCYTVSSVARVCERLALDFDTYTGRKLKYYELIEDLTQFNPISFYHGPYCEDGRAVRLKEKKLEQESFNLYLKKEQESLSKKKIRNHSDVYYQTRPLVLDFELIGNTLAEVVPLGKKSKQYQAAMMIVEGVLQPLSNVGARKILAGQKAIAEGTGLTPAQVAKGLMWLRRAHIIRIENKQMPGFATMYMVSTRFVDSELTKYMRHEWLLRKDRGVREPLIYSARNNVFMGAHSQEVVPISSPLTHLRSNDQQKFLQEQLFDETFAKNIVKALLFREKSQLTA